MKNKQLDLFGFEKHESISNIDDFSTDETVFNKGTKKGMRLLERLIKNFGCGRSVLADNDNFIIAGNKIFETAKKVGVKKVIVVETTGDELVIVKRTDIQHGSTKQKEFAITDNISSEQNLNYDTNLIISQMNNDYSFDPRKWEGHSCIVKELTLEEYLKDNVVLSDKSAKGKQNDENVFTQLSLF